LLPEEVSYGSSSEDKLSCLSIGSLPIHSDSKKGAPGLGHPASRII
jgi:hypothetical protein